MARDYVRSQPKKRKPTSRKNTRITKAAPRSRFPVVAAGLALAALSGFGYFLYSVSGSAGQQPTPEIAQVKPTPAKPSKPEPKPSNGLPEKPDDKWDYISTLPKKEVKVEVPKETKPTKPYQMQCGSFRKKSQAEQLKANIAFQGVSSTIRRVEGKSGVWYKVVLGPYPRKRLAESERHKLQRAKINYCRIWFWEGALPSSYNPEQSNKS